MTSLIRKVSTGDGRQTSVKALVEMYKDIAQNSVPCGGKIKRIRQNKFSLTSQFKTTNCDTLEYIQTTKSYFMSTNENEIEFIETLIDTNDKTIESNVAYSKNGRFIAKLKTPKADSQILEIWDRSKLMKSFNINEIETHGLIVNNPELSSFCWSPFGEQDKFLYICNSKQPKHLSFFKDVPKTKDTDKSDVRGDEFNEKQSWGERLETIYHTVLVILDVSNDCKITTIDMDGYSLTNSTWFDNGSKIVSIGIKETPRKLGILYCNNRPSKVIIHNLENLSNQILELDNDVYGENINKNVDDKNNEVLDYCYHSIRVNNNGDKFIFQSNPQYGKHYRSSKIYLYDFKIGKSKLLIDRKTNNSEFFPQKMTENCFTIDDKNILFISADYLTHNMCLFNLELNLLTKIKFPTTGVSILDFNYNIIMALGSDINASPTIFVAQLNSNDPTNVVGWHQIEDCIHFAEIDYDQFKIPTNDGKSFISSILIRPNLPLIQSDYNNYNIDEDKNNKSIINNNNKLPTIVHIHGGPYSAFNITYNQSLILYSRSGFNIILINYRGSTGINEEYMNSLTGKIGLVDVEDCLTAINYFSKEKKMIDQTKLIISGGSHGGFLAAHLSCLNELKFSSAIIRNPVIDLSSLHSASDIPDWCYEVCLGHKNFDFTYWPNKDDLIKLYECSPITKVNLATPPTLMLLGNKDLRVPMYQGKRWVDILKARGIKTLCKVYNDYHALDSAETLADATITTILWMLDHNNKN